MKLILLLGIAGLSFWGTKYGVTTYLATTEEMPLDQALTPIPTIMPTVTSSPVPTIAVQSSTASSEEINSFINNYASQYGVDPNVIRHVALCESAFNPNAKNYIYGGLFQFSPTTWASWRNKMQEDANTELRFNVEEAVQTAAYVLAQGKGDIWPNCMP